MARVCDYCERPERGNVQLWRGVDKTSRQIKWACKAHKQFIQELPRGKEAAPRRPQLWFEKETPHE